MYLKPCPFCGNEPPVITPWEPERGRGSSSFTVECGSAGCGVEIGWYDAEEEAVAFWNTRPAGKIDDPCPACGFCDTMRENRP